MGGIDEARASFERDARRLVGRTVKGVRYWDVHNFSDEPRVWDYGVWHHAVMGVELETERYPFTITWTNRFYPYGVEVFEEPISRHLLLGENGPEGWDASASDRWQALLGVKVQGVEVHWERIDLGPAVRLSDGAQVGPAESHDVPVAMRLDLGQDLVWFVAGIPQWPDMDKVFVMGDEIMVVFEPEKLVGMGFPSNDFSAAPGG